VDYSPKLKEAMAEIKAVLEKHDIAGYVVLYENHLQEFLLKIDPSWSLCFFEEKDDKVGIRFRSKLADFGGDRAAQKNATEVSTGMLRHFADACLRDARIFEMVLSMLAEHFEITHTGGKLRPDWKH